MPFKRTAPVKPTLQESVKTALVRPRSGSAPAQVQLDRRGPRDLRRGDWRLALIQRRRERATVVQARARRRRVRAGAAAAFRLRRRVALVAGEAASSTNGRRRRGARRRAADEARIPRKAGPRPEIGLDEVLLRSRRRRVALARRRRRQNRQDRAPRGRGHHVRAAAARAVLDRSSVRTRNSPTFRRDVQQQEKRISTFGYRTQSRTRGKDRSLSRLRTTRRSPWKTPRPGRVPDVAIPLRALERGVSPSKFWRRSRFIRRRSPRGAPRAAPPGR